MPLAARNNPELLVGSCTHDSKIVLDKKGYVRYLIPFFGKIQNLYDVKKSRSHHQGPIKQMGYWRETGPPSAFHPCGY